MAFSKIVILHGFQMNITKFLNESHCLIIPSLWEGMPVSLLEAGATGMPVIASPVGSIPDFLTVENGYPSQLEDFHQSMILVMDNYKFALEKGKKLFVLVNNNYGINMVLKKNIEIYKKVLGH